MVALIYVARLEQRKMRQCSMVAIFNDDGKVLLLRRAPGDPWMPRKWALPGGGVDEGETFHDGAVREVKEETHIDINDPSLLKTFHEMYGGKTKFMICKNNHTGNVDLSSASHGYEHNDYGWFSKSELKTLELVPDLEDILFIAFEALEIF